MQDRIRNCRVSTNRQFNQLTAYLETKWFPKLSVSLNNSAKCNIIQLRPVLVPEFSQFSSQIFWAAHILQGNLLGQVPGLRQIWHYSINHWQIAVAMGTDKTSISHSKHQTNLLSWITRPRLSFGCTCINASTCWHSGLYLKNKMIARVWCRLNEWEDRKRVKNSILLVLACPLNFGNAQVIASRTL